MPLPLPAKFYGEGLLALGPTVLFAVKLGTAVVELTPETITGSNESMA